MICQLHLGLAEGLTEGLGGLTVERLVSKTLAERVAGSSVRRDAA